MVVAQNVSLLFFMILKAVISSQVKLLRHVILTFESVNKILSCYHSNKTRSIQHYFHGVVLNV